MSDARATPPNRPGEIDAGEVHRLVDQIGASASFARSEQLNRFLRFVVEETLAGRGDLLKEYRIAVEGLGKSTRFDPSVDSVVRVQARQLRYKLDAFFRDEGKAARLRI